MKRAMWKKHEHRTIAFGTAQELSTMFADFAESKLTDNKWIIKLFLRRSYIVLSYYGVSKAIERQPNEMKWK